MEDVLAENLEGLKSSGAVDENFDVDDYVDVDFDVSVIGSFSCLTDKEILEAVCNAEE